MATNLNNLVRLTKSQIKPASKMLARVFRDNPLFVYYFPDSSKREDKLQYTFEFMIRDNIRNGEIYATSSNLEGIAAWSPSEKAQITIWRALLSGGMLYVLRVGRKTIFKMISNYYYIFSIHKRLAPFRHWYLSLIGVDPIFQGKGYAGTLLKAMLARIDQENLPCYLDTNDEKNVSIYQRYGFKVLEEYRLPGTEFTNWAMLREKPS